MEECNLGLPTIVKLLKKLKKKLNIDLNEYQYNLNDAYNEIKNKVGEHHE